MDLRGKARGQRAETDWKILSSAVLRAEVHAEDD